MYLVVVGPVIICPTKIDCEALESVYTAKLCGIPLSILLKLMVTCAPAGTVMVLILKAIFCATRFRVVPPPGEEPGEGEAAGGALAEGAGEAGAEGEGAALGAGEGAGEGAAEGEGVGVLVDAPGAVVEPGLGITAFAPGVAGLGVVVGDSVACGTRVGETTAMLVNGVAGVAAVCFTAAGIQAESNAKLDMEIKEIKMMTAIIKAGPPANLLFFFITFTPCE